MPARAYRVRVPPPARATPIPAEEEDERLAHALRDEPDEHDDGEDGRGAEHLAGRRQHQERGEAAEDEEGGREGPSGVCAEPEPDEERGAEHHDP